MIYNEDIRGVEFEVAFTVDDEGREAEVQRLHQKPTRAHVTSI